MKISKEIFNEILGILEHDDLIYGYTINVRDNTINVYSDLNHKKNYQFDDNNNLINPQVFEIQEKIKELEKEKKELENKLNYLLTNN